MTHAYMPIGMGVAMGTMMGWMVTSGAVVEAGIGFVLAHVVVIGALLALSILVPSVRRFLGAHFANRGMWRNMGLGMIAGVIIGVIAYPIVQGAV